MKKGIHGIRGQLSAIAEVPAKNGSAGDKDRTPDFKHVVFDIVLATSWNSMYSRFETIQFVHMCFALLNVQSWFGKL